MTISYIPRRTIQICRARGRLRHDYYKKSFERWHSNSPTPSPSSPDNTVLPKSLMIGTIAGMCGSLAGMGGGFLMIPLMTSKRLLGLTQHQAHGTSLFAVATTGLAGAISYSGEVDFEAAGMIALFGMATASIGANATTKLSGATLKKALGVFMLLVAPTIPLKDYFTDPEKKEKKELEKSDKVEDLFTDMNHYQALGTSLCAMVPTAIVGTATHMGKGSVAMKVAPGLALGAFTGAYFGGKLGLSIPEKELKYGFSATMVVLGLRTLL
ncbi:hypothetical protein FRACYDRAFT_247682 [Fragilariopsis cylindrus CCMP1102]|uniref:Membrane transporter protein n=1 Tax=Fragilariopsis cylindrus CCMP1102 TaxID=635003 RepID=A0A1E7EW04_9STRA|nr:hypothetical protein FRACYDRAFT_247682 [Fragilariopsis cylindrus CCMP1102]|eukprot:OEU10072.1 hypothetical protein FRACYDRAFT_247682 [Fragilariopsis cylindrus CCMP1102]